MVTGTSTTSGNGPPLDNLQDWLSRLPPGFYSPAAAAKDEEEEEGKGGLTGGGGLITERGLPPAFRAAAPPYLLHGKYFKHPYVLRRLQQLQQQQQRQPSGSGGDGATSMVLTPPLYSSTRQASSYPPSHPPSGGIGSGSSPLPPPSPAPNRTISGPHPSSLTSGGGAAREPYPSAVQAPPGTAMSGQGSALPPQSGGAQLAPRLATATQALQEALAFRCSYLSAVLLQTPPPSHLPLADIARELGRPPPPAAVGASNAQQHEVLVMLEGLVNARQQNLEGMVRDALGGGARPTAAFATASMTSPHPSSSLPPFSAPLPSSFSSAPAAAAGGGGGADLGLPTSRPLLHPSLEGSGPIPTSSSASSFTSAASLMGLTPPPSGQQQRFSWETYESEHSSAYASREALSTVSLAEVVINPIEDFKRENFPWSDDLRRTMRELFGLHEYRSMQLEVMNACLSQRDVLVLLPTGGGKSLCYQLPALLPNPAEVTIVVSPLISLIQDQIYSLTSNDIPSIGLTGSTDEAARRALYDEWYTGNIAHPIVFVTPEFFGRSDALVEKLTTLLRRHRKLNRFVVDEAHCVSQWGHDFRPDYRKLSVLKHHFPTVPITTLTATATETVQQDILKTLRLSNAIVFQGSFNRPNLQYSVIAVQGGGGRKNTTAKSVVVDLVRHRFPPRTCGIVYCLSKRDCEEMAAELRKAGVLAAFYHADTKDKASVQEAWTRDALHVICATIAFGMGINKPDVRFVVHAAMPKSIEGFFQESGRAGRDGLPSECILLYHVGDKKRQQGLIQHSNDQAALMLSLNQMLAYTMNNVECRRYLQLTHFGEPASPQYCLDTQSTATPCVLCDNCESREKQGWRVKAVDISTILVELSQLLQHLGSMTGKQLLGVYRGVTSAYGKIVEQRLRERGTPAAFKSGSSYPQALLERVLIEGLLRGLWVERLVVVNDFSGGAAAYLSVADDNSFSSARRGAAAPPAGRGTVAHPITLSGLMNGTTKATIDVREEVPAARGGARAAATAASSAQGASAALGSTSPSGAAAAMISTTSVLMDEALPLTSLCSSIESERAAARKRKVKSELKQQQKKKAGRSVYVEDECEGSSSSMAEDDDVDGSSFITSSEDDDRSTVMSSSISVSTTATPQRPSSRGLTSQEEEDAILRLNQSKLKKQKTQRAAAAASATSTGAAAAKSFRVPPARMVRLKAILQTELENLVRRLAGEREGGRSYNVMPKHTLRALIDTLDRPSWGSVTDLTDLEGFGRNKVKKFGQEILSAYRKFRFEYIGDLPELSEAEGQEIQRVTATKAQSYQQQQQQQPPKSNTAAEKSSPASASLLLLDPTTPDRGTTAQGATTTTATVDSLPVQPPPPPLPASGASRRTTFKLKVSGDGEDDAPHPTTSSTTNTTARTAATTASVTYLPREEAPEHVERVGEKRRRSAVQPPAIETQAYSIPLFPAGGYESLPPAPAVGGNHCTTSVTILKGTSSSTLQTADDAGNDDDDGEEDRLFQMCDDAIHRSSIQYIRGGSGAMLGSNEEEEAEQRRRLDGSSPGRDRRSNGMVNIIASGEHPQSTTHHNTWERREKDDNEEMVVVDSD